jgi:hypothetical protein
MSLGTNNPKILAVWGDDSSIEFGSEKYKPIPVLQTEKIRVITFLEFFRQGAIQRCEPVPGQCEGNIRSSGDQRVGWLHPI